LNAGGLTGQQAGKTGIGIIGGNQQNTGQQRGNGNGFLFFCGFDLAREVALA